MKSTHPQITAKTSKTYPQSPNLSRAESEGCRVWLREPGLGCPKVMGTAAGIAQEEERMQELPGNTLEGLMCCAVLLRRLWQGLRDMWDAEPEESLLCCTKDSWIHHQLPLVFCSPSGASPSSGSPRHQPELWHSKNCSSSTRSQRQPI